MLLRKGLLRGEGLAIPSRAALGAPGWAELPRAHRTGATQLQSRCASCWRWVIGLLACGAAVVCWCRWGCRRELWLSLSGSLSRARSQGAVSSLRCGPHLPLDCCARQCDALQLEPSLLVRAEGPWAAGRVGRQGRPGRGKRPRWFAFQGANEFAGVFEGGLAVGLVGV